MEKESKGLMILVVILLIIVVGLGGYITYDKLSSKDINQEKPNGKNNTTNVEDLTEAERLVKEFAYVLRYRSLDETDSTTDHENYKKILDINLIAPFLLSQKIAPKMKENKYGVIINISSTNALDTPYIESIDYDSSKAGLISVSNNLANYLSPYVRVNTVCPGWIDTEMNQNLDNDFKEKEEEKILLKRFGKPEEVAELISFLISDKASYINNSIIRIDGGKKC